MSEPRIIPVLLLGKSGLVKTTRFEAPRYIGDPINTVRIFNEKNADELVLLDIYATSEGRAPDFDRIKMIATECRMPLAYGGGITDLRSATQIIESGVEKVVLGASAINSPDLITEISAVFGRQSVSAVFDYRKALLGGRSVFLSNGKKKVSGDLMQHVQRALDAGAGEIIFNSIADDGMMHGFDLKLVADISDHVDTPMTFIGGCGTLDHLKTLFSMSSFVGAGVGSMFVYKSALKGVLVNYPAASVKAELIAKCSAP